MKKKKKNNDIQNSMVLLASEMERGVAKNIMNIYVIITRVCLSSRIDDAFKKWVPWKILHRDTYKVVVVVVVDSMEYYSDTLDTVDMVEESYHFLSHLVIYYDV